MQTGTPHPGGAPGSREARRRVRAALRSLAAAWKVSPTGVTPADLEQALAPALASIARVGGPGAAAHMRRVGALAEAIAAEAGWGLGRAAVLRIHGALHDVGKVAVGPALLEKSGPLSAEERGRVARHTTAGFRLLLDARIPLLRDAARVARDHHEWWDGRGYPRRLAGLRIDANARAVAVADVFDALTSSRPYRDALPLDAALEVMHAGRGRQFDPELFDAFLRIVHRRTDAVLCILAA